MKKLLALVLAVAMLCCVLPVMAETVTSYTLYLNSVIYGETAVNPSDLGMSITITLNTDGTGSMETNG